MALYCGLLPGRLSRYSNAQTLVLSLSKDRLRAIRTWFDRLTTNGFSRTLQSSWGFYQGLFKVS